MVLVHIENIKEIITHTITIYDLVQIATPL